MPASRSLFVGPDGFDEQRGYPKVVAPAKRGQDQAVAEQLWSVSEGLTGVEYGLGGAEVAFDPV